MPVYDDYLNKLKSIKDRSGEQKMNEGPYRNDSFTKTLEDHGERINLLEYFVDGRAKCTGDELQNKFDSCSRKMKFETRTLRVCLSVLALALAAWIFIDLLTMEGIQQEEDKRIDELETRIVMQELEVKSLRSALKCISEHSYKIAEVRDSL